MLDFNDAPRQGPILSEVTPADWAARVDALHAAVNSHAEAVVRTLLPGARIQGQKARVGSLAGEPGESIVIELAGPKVGQWKEHNPGAAGKPDGDLITLWMELEGRTFAEAVDDLERWVGITPGAKWETRVAKRGEARAREHAARPVEEGTFKTTDTYRYLSEDGTLLAFVHRQEHTHRRKDNGKPEKKFLQQRADGTWAQPEGLRPLYRLPEIKGAKTVVLVEGEKCVEALARCSVPATTAMAGSSADPEKTDWRPLAGKRVIIWPDNDEAGRFLPEKVRPLLEQLGCEVWVVPIPAGKPEKWDSADAVEEGDDIDALLSSARPDAPSPAATARFKFLSIDQLMDIEPPEWRIDGIFPTHGTSLLYGSYETYKTFVALDMALHLACALPTWHGRPLKPCPVAYIVGEGQHGIGARVLGWLTARGLDPADAQAFHALPEVVALPKEGDVEALIAALRELPVMPGLIVFDTVTRMTGGGSLNDEKDMQAYLRGSDAVRKATGAHVMHVGHAGKMKEKGFAGSFVLPAGLETMICIEREADLAVRLVNEHPKGKQKEGPAFADICFDLREIEFDHRGHELRSIYPTLADTRPVVEEEPTDEHWSDAARTARQAERQLTAAQMLILSELRVGKVRGKTWSQMSLSGQLRVSQGTVSKALAEMTKAGCLIEKAETPAGMPQQWTAAGAPQDWPGFLLPEVPDDEDV